VSISEGVNVAYFAQHAADALNASDTVEEALLSVAEFDDAPKIRNILGAFGFSGDDVKKRISVLSGGEKNRVALAQMLFRKAGLLLLDEPTNHLDIQSRQVLEYALRTFQGAYIVVSHDRYFVNEVADRIVHVDRKLSEFIGDYDDYLASLVGEKNTFKEVSESSKKKTRQEAADVRKRVAHATQGIRKEISKIEKQIEALEESISSAEKAFLEVGFYDDGKKAAKRTKMYTQEKGDLESFVEKWEALEEKLSLVENEIKEA